MKSEKGITLTSLVMYVVVTILVIGILTKISTTFYNNMKYMDAEGIFAVEYQKFNSNFIEDIKTIGVKKLEINTDEKYVLLYNERTNEQIKYNFKDTGIYRNEVLISSKVITSVFKYNENILSIVLEYNGQGKEKVTSKTLEFYLT